jgi:hypothetical protein
MNPLRTTGTRTFLNATMIFISISPEIVWLSYDWKCLLKLSDTDLTKNYFPLLPARKKLTGLYFVHRKRTNNKIFTLSGFPLPGPVNHIDIWPLWKFWKINYRIANCRIRIT